MTKLLRKFAGKKDGVAAIEFAILAPAFFALMAAIFEISFFIYANSSAQRALEDVIYDMRTGHIYAQFVTAGNPPPEQYIKKEICKKASIPNCLDTIKLVMEKYDEDYKSYANSNDTGEFDGGASGILMRLEAQIQVPSVAFGEAIFGEDNMKVTAGLTFMTEPY
jgi:hypothetical protein